MIGSLVINICGLLHSVMVGTTALPTIIKMATIMKEKKNEWSQQDELPVCMKSRELADRECGSSGLGKFLVVGC